MLVSVLGNYTMVMVADFIMKFTRKYIRNIIKI